MGLWLKQSLCAWALLSLAIGLALALTSGTQLKTLSDRALSPIVLGVGAGVFSAAPTFVFALIVFAPARLALVGSQRTVPLAICAIGVLLFASAAMRLPKSDGDGWTNLFWLWLGAAIASFSAVLVFQPTLK